MRNAYFLTRHTGFHRSADIRHLHGDSLALWITSERAQPGPVFGSKGKRHTLSSATTKGYEYNLQTISQELGSSSVRAHLLHPKYSELELIVHHGIDRNRIGIRLPLSSRDCHAGRWEDEF